MKVDRRWWNDGRFERECGAVGFDGALLTLPWGLREGWELVPGSARLVGNTLHYTARPRAPLSFVRVDLGFMTLPP